MAASLFFVLNKLNTYKEHIGESLIEPRIYAFIPIFCIFHGFASMFLSHGWIALLRAQGVKPVTLSWKEAFHFYGVTQIAKYIPGNIFHFAGRHSLANQKGVLHVHLFFAAALEIFFVFFSAILISFLIIGRTSHTFYDGKAPFSIFLIIGGGVILFLLFIFKNHSILQQIKNLNLLKATLSLFSYLSFIIFSCLLFLCTVITVSGHTSACLENWPSIMGGYAFAWVIGFVTPGAPGGVGVREATLIHLMTSTFSEPDLIVSILAFRVVTTLGDIVFFTLSLLTPTHADLVK